MPTADNRGGNMNDIHITSEAPDGSGADRTWMDGWTIFYWGWWIAWAPFVGMFIAKISRGRTVRQIINGSMFGAAFLSFRSTRCSAIPAGVRCTGPVLSLIHI